MKYHLHSEKIKDKITLMYIGGVLREVRLPEGMTEVQYEWLFKNVPKNEALVAQFAEQGNFILYSVRGYAFEDFWEGFGNKLGKKERVKRLWDSLSEVEQDKVMISIVRYKQYLALNPHIAQCYPETYLSQKRWENEYN